MANLRDPGIGPVIRAEGLTKVYRSGPVEVQALRGVDFTAAAGEFVVILGPSGSGKSTFLNILGGLDRASEGVVNFFDDDLTAMSDAQLLIRPDLFVIYAAYFTRAS